MRTLTTTELSKQANRAKFAVTGDEPLDLRRHRVRDELSRIGITSYGLRSSEARYLPMLIHPGEHVEGAIYGRNTEGFAMIVATGLRVLYLDKKPFFVKTDELSYGIISGVSFGTAGIFASVTLHSRIGDYNLGLVKNQCARAFVGFIERNCLEGAA